VLETLIRKKELLFSSQFLFLVLVSHQKRYTFLYAFTTKSYKGPLNDASGRAGRRPSRSQSIDDERSGKGEKEEPQEGREGLTFVASAGMVVAAVGDLVGKHIGSIRARMDTESRGHGDSGSQGEDCVQGIETEDNLRVAFSKQGKAKVEEREEGEDASEQGKVDFGGGTAVYLLVYESAGEGESDDCEEELDTSEEGIEKIHSHDDLKMDGFFLFCSVLLMRFYCRGYKRVGFFIILLLLLLSCCI